MGPTGALARTWLRRNVAVTVLLGALVALLVGTSAGAFAGARRTASSLDRLLAYNRPPHLQISTVDGSSFDVEAVTSLPQVAGWATGAYGMLTAEGPGGGPFNPGDVNPFISIGAGGDVPYRPFVVDGREPRSDEPHELAVDEEAARRLGAEVGDTITLRLFTPDQMASMFESSTFPAPQGAEVRTTLTGIIRHAFDVTPGKPEHVEAVQLASSEVYPSVAFWERYADEMAAYGDGTDGAEVRLHGGEEAIPAFEAAIAELPGGDRLAVESSSDAVVAVEDARQAVRFEAVATALFGVVALVAGLVLVGQAAARQIRAELEQGDVLRAMGLTPREVASAAVLRMSGPVLAGAVAGAVVALASSAAMPFGTAAKAEIDPGLRLDPAPVAATAVLVAVLVLWWVARAARSVQSAGPAPDAPTVAGRLASAAAAAGAPVSVVFGLCQLGRQRGTTPVRSSLGGITFATAAVVAIGVFAATTDRFVERPEEHAWSWDVMVGDSDDPTLSTDAPELLADEPGVDGFASLWGGSEDVVDAGGRGVAIVGLDQLAGRTYVQVTDGRAASSAEEVVLGRRTIDQLGLAVGDEVSLAGPAGDGTFLVVGEASLHQLVNDEFELGEGAVTSSDGLRRLFGDDMQVVRFLVDLAPGADQAAVMSSLREPFGPTVVAHVPPLDVASLQGTQHLPLLLGAVIGAIGAGSLVHLLLVTVRRRRAAFGLLRALGARRAQVSASVASMATVTVLGALVVGVPLGVVAGRSAWRALAEGLGAATSPVVPVALVVGGAIAVVVVANLIAAVPALLIRRASPAEALRTE